MQLPSKIYITCNIFSSLPYQSLLILWFLSLYETMAKAFKLIFAESLSLKLLARFDIDSLYVLSSSNLSWFCYTQCLPHHFHYWHGWARQMNYKAWFLSMTTRFWSMAIHQHVTANNDDTCISGREDDYVTDHNCRLKRAGTIVWRAMENAFKESSLLKFLGWQHLSFFSVILFSVLSFYGLFWLCYMQCFAASLIRWANQVHIHCVLRLQSRMLGSGRHKTIKLGILQPKCPPRCFLQ
ncbi:hypothetical protein NC653_015290 [Populus alba x Populus x berolinensis]|uniref:Uncharacterized protein n=1 Tax=Populus alba x Populus x berolinensis TaxID=444605 RepID=A0AAD6QKD8_9ROSI|nr:hypothetical protein NC653_015290 [Populus alba x Populus x berolinensis]